MNKQKAGNANEHVSFDYISHLVVKCTRRAWCKKGREMRKTKHIVWTRFIFNETFQYDVMYT